MGGNIPMPVDTHKKMTGTEIRQKFLDFFVSKGHYRMPSSSLVPRNDPTVLLTTAGMQQMIPFFLGRETPPALRLTSAQKCFRTTDIERVGNERTLTFFEKLPSISKKVNERSLHTLSISVVRKPFCAEVRRSAGGVSRPRKKGIICCMPAVVSSTVGSFLGTSEELGILKWPLPTKKSRNFCRISVPVIFFCISTGISIFPPHPEPDCFFK